VGGEKGNEALFEAELESGVRRQLRAPEFQWNKIGCHLIDTTTS